jgi:hypothetical protein
MVCHFIVSITCPLCIASSLRESAGTYRSSGKRSHGFIRIADIWSAPYDTFCTQAGNAEPNFGKRGLGTKSAFINTWCQMLGLAVISDYPSWCGYLQSVIEVAIGNLKECIDELPQ